MLFCYELFPFTSVVIFHYFVEAQGFFFHFIFYLISFLGQSFLLSRVKSAQHSDFNHKHIEIQNDAGCFRLAGILCIIPRSVLIKDF